MPTLAIDIPREELRAFCKKWKVTEFALFGSAVRASEFRDDSDVDVLVSFAPDADHSLSAWLAMRDELAQIFGREVDLAERENVQRMRNYLRRAAILESAVPVDLA